MLGYPEIIAGSRCHISGGNEVEETRSLQRGPLVVRPLRRGTLPSLCGYAWSAQERLFSVNPQTYAEGQELVTDVSVRP